jgi:hypothetical protein
MSPENESGIPEEARNFTAPDESERVEDPDKAESMARASDEWRSEAAEHRKRAQDLKDIGAVGSGHELHEAQTQDMAAELVEQFAGTEHDIERQIAQIPEAELSSRSQQVDKQLSDIQSRIELVDKSPSPADDEGKEKYLNKLQDLRKQETRLELMKKFLEERGGVQK